MAENGIQATEVESFRRNLGSSEAREHFYEPATYPFPPVSDTDELKKSEQQQDLDNVPSKLSQLGDIDHPEVKPKRSISQEIIGVAYETARDITYQEKPVVTEEPSAETDVSSNDSTKSLFGSLIVSPSPASSRVDRVEELAEDQESVHDVELPPRQTASRPRYYSNRATTLPAKLEVKEFDPSKHPKLTKWEIFKRKFILGAAHVPTRGPIPNADTEIPRASTAGPIDTESFCGVTNIEGLDLEGMPPMTQRSRKLFSWTRLKTGFPFKRKSGRGKNDGEPKVDPVPKASVTKVVEHDSDEPQASSQGAEEEEEEEEEEEAISVATSKTKPEKDKTHSWFEVLSQRLFTARRHRTSEVTTSARPATAAAQTPQYYEIESNW